MSNITDIVAGNLITIGIVMMISTVITVEVKKELFLNGRTNTFYNLKFF